MNKKILVVDDDTDFLEELAEALSMRGFQIIAVDDVNAIFEVVEKTRPNLILLDLKMPGKSGIQLASELKENNEFSNIPIVAMSAFMKDSYEDLLASCGITTWFKKPFNIDGAAKEIAQIVKTTVAYQ